MERQRAFHEMVVVHPGKDSLMVEETHPHIDERMLRLQRAGYAQMNVMMRGNSFNVDTFDSMSLPAGKSEGIGSLDRRLTVRSNVIIHFVGV